MTQTSRTKPKKHPEGYAVDIYQGAAGIKLATAYGASPEETRLRADAVEGAFHENEPTPLRIALVYQAGIANVVRVSSFNLADFGRDAYHLLQADFREAEAYARGMGEAGAVVRSMHCNMAGDIRHEKWSENLEDAPFNTQFRPVHRN